MKSLWWWWWWWSSINTSRSRRLVLLLFCLGLSASLFQLDLLADNHGDWYNGLLPQPSDDMSDQDQPEQRRRMEEEEEEDLSIEECTRITEVNLDSEPLHFGNPLFLLVNDHVIYVVLEPLKECNIFHALWSYVTPFYNLMTTLQKKNTVAIQVHVLLEECHAWLEQLLLAFPVGPYYTISIQTTRTNDWQAFFAQQRQKNTERHHLNDPEYYYYSDTEWFQEGQDTFPTDRSNCFLLESKWMSFGEGVHHERWNQPSSNHGQYLQPWLVDSMRNRYLPVARKRKRRPLALLVERSCTSFARQLVDMTTGMPLFSDSVFLQNVRNLGYDTQVLTVCGRNDTLQQYQDFAQADVVVSVHGAQLANLIFLPTTTSNDGNNNTIPSFFFPPALVEISFRFAWCRPTRRNTTSAVEHNGTHEALLQQWRQPHCTNHESRYYPKADYFAIATAMGIRYTEVLHHAVIPYPRATRKEQQNPIQVAGVIVDSTLILQELKRLHEDPTYEHATYNGKEGVHRYKIGVRASQPEATTTIGR
ncbi:expressed unknown protein [Seminavis robusta]|uniref:Uncharacterized protein n=1 Tax=Seminavis robusta TaxID=568900 RepID=A0A9N8H3A3_9STRA|nr:expressed unknown protein [Seminavis robusta]|eukprot:Sro55_g032380.1 n/a (532) ;mRNA; r:93957-95552